ncbi:MAG: hypothetical protein OHK0052_02950 [Anaerolineales bacterium]
MKFFIKNQQFLFSVSIALLAGITLLFAPFWAYEWYQQPFLGVFLEANNVMSLIGGEDWAALQAGATWPDRLMAVNQQSVPDTPALYAALRGTLGKPTLLTFERRDGSQYTLTVTTRAVRPGELFTFFGIPYLTALTFLGNGLWTFWVGRKQRSARAFLVAAASISLTLGTFFDMNTSRYALLGWTLSLPMVASSMMYLALVFPQESPLVTRFPKLRHFPWLITLGFLPFGVREILFPSNPWSYINVWRVSYVFVGLGIIAFIAMLVARTLRGSTPVIMQQSRIMLFGALLAFSPILWLYFLPIAFGFVPVFRPILYLPTLVLLPISVGYAILRYRLMDVDRWLGDALVYTLTTAGGLALFYVFLALASLIIQSQVNVTDPLFVALFLVLMVLALNPLHQLAQKTIDNVFYRSRADYRVVLSRLAQAMVTTPDLSRVQRILKQEIDTALNPETFLLFLHDDDDRLYRAFDENGQQQATLSQTDALPIYLERGDGALWLPQGSVLPEALFGSAIRRHCSTCEVFIPLRYEGRLIGFLALGARRSGDPYSSDDLNFLQAAAGQSTLAVEIARLFNNLQRTFNETLEMKNLMDDIFASIASGVITTDIQNKVTLFNQSAEKILGVSAQQIVGKNLSQVLGGIVPRFEKMTRSTLELGAITQGEEVSPILPGRSKAFWRISTSPLLNAYHETKGLTLVIDDLTEQRNLEAERERIRQTFGKVVAPRVRDRLLSDPRSLRLDGMRQTLTVMFADLHNFTNYSERSVPEELFQNLNRYLSLAAQAVLEEEGTLDKFMGDAVLAFWNAPDPQPDHTLRAVRAALLMNRAIAQFRANTPEAALLTFRVGITTGEAMVGNVGTSELFNYTVIGDTVNLAQRLQSSAPPGEIWISQPVYQAVADQILATRLPPVKVKGKEQPVEVYRLEGLRG